MASNKVRIGIILILLVIFLSQAFSSMWDDSPTYDEAINPSVGYAELITGDVSLVYDHPPLYRVFNALPLFAFRPNLPLDHESWQKREKGNEDRYEFARQFFYQADEDADRLLFWSRVPTVFLSLLLGLLVFQWAKGLYGETAGLFALFLYTFEPNIIAHSRLATNDLVLALFVFSTIYQFWQYSVAPSLKSLTLTGLLLGFALISKFSAVILFPMLFPLVFLAPHVSQKNSDGRTEIMKVHVSIGVLGMALKAVFLISIIAVAVVFLFYGTEWRLYTKGFYKTVAYYRVGRSAFLMGNYSTGGWWYYFPIAFLLKTPIPLLIFLVVAFLFLSFRKEKAEYFLLIPIGIIVSTALLSHLNIGIRHILPVYPFLIVLASSITTIHFSRPKLFLTSFGGLALWYLFSTLSIFPSYVAYFNEFVGPKRGYLYLVDSNLDWGQDLKRLKTFMDENGITRVYLSYFGKANPCYYGIRLRYLPGFPEPSFFSCGDGPDDIRPDFIAISPTNLQSVYLSDKKSFAWLKGYKPIAQIGYSIFVYDIRGDAFAHNNLGILYIKSRVLDEALNEFKLLVELAPEDSTGHSNLGFTYALLSFYDKAEAAYRKALELDPENKVAKEGLKGLKRIAAQVE